MPSLNVSFSRENPDDVRAVKAVGFSFIGVSLTDSNQERGRVSFIRFLISLFSVSDVPYAFKREPKSDPIKSAGV